MNESLESLKEMTEGLDQLQDRLRDLCPPESESLAQAKNLLLRESNFAPIEKIRPSKDSDFLKKLIKTLDKIIEIS